MRQLNGFPTHRHRRLRQTPTSSTSIVTDNQSQHRFFNEHLTQQYNQDSSLNRKSQYLTNINRKSRYRQSGSHPVLERFSITTINTMRLLSFTAGFMLLYYFLFAKHHSHDREVNALQTEIENLMREVTKTGFMRENFVEAVLPEIFREKNNETTASPSPQPSQILQSSSTVKKEEKTKILKRTKSKKKEKVKTSVPNDKSSPNRKEISTPDKYLDSDEKELGQSNRVDLIEVTKNSTNTSSIPHNSHSENEGHNEDGSSETRNVSSRNSSGVARTTTEDVENGQRQDPDLLGSTSIPDYNYNFEKEFKDVEDTELPEDETYLLKWKYDSIINPGTSEQIFGLGNKLDHVAVFKPLCVEVATGHLISFGDNAVCGGFNRTDSWMDQYCEPMRESVIKEFLFEVKRINNSEKWVSENSKFIQWVDGLTVLQLLEKNCGNIAHFSGRALLLHHILQNLASYAAPPSRADNVLVIPTFHTMKRFIKPEIYDYWHESVMKAIVSPTTYNLGTLGDFLKSKQETKSDHRQLVYLLHNLTLQESQKDKKYVCFNRVIVPGFLKARFFVDDFEYPSARPSLQNNNEGAPTVPRDSLRMREKMSSTIHGTPVFKKKEKVILFIDRNGKRRVFDDDAKKKVITLFEEVSNMVNYKFKVVSFDKTPFPEQYMMMESASIAIGIHGANLVNTMFMPPLAVLMELFPFGFSHEMYERGGNAGLKYYAYQMKTGTKFKGPKTYTSVEQCIRYSHDCKVHYRDAVMKVTDEDLDDLRKLLKEAIDWCNRVND